MGRYRPIRSEILEDYGLEFNIRVGIKTGLVVIGEMGTQAAVAYKAMGDAINVATRIEATETPDTL